MSWNDLIGGDVADELVSFARAHFIHRFTNNGVTASDFLDVTNAIERWDEWCGAWCKRAEVHEGLGREALASGRLLSAGEHLNRAATYYHFGKYLFFQDMAQHKAAHRKAVECRTLALPHLDPPGERVLIPYEGKHLAGVLRLPAKVERAPIALITMGLDNSKEETDTFETAFLRRGMAVLAFDGPGMGEAEYDFPIRPDFEAVVKQVIDWLETRKDVDAARVGMYGQSLGGYYAPRAAAFEKRLKACIANSGPFRFDSNWDRLPKLTREAFRIRSHSASDEEARRRAGELSLEGIGAKIECPMFVIATGLDTLCLPEDMERLAAESAGPVELLYLEDAVHVGHNRTYQYLPRAADWMAKQLGV